MASLLLRCIRSAVLLTTALLFAIFPNTAAGQGNGNGHGNRSGGISTQAVEPGSETPPYIWFEPEGRTFYGATQTITVHYCDAEQITSGSSRIWLNGTLVTHTVSTGAAGVCNVHRVATVSLTFASGSNKVKARACETSQTATCGNDSTYYIFTTPDPVKPTAQVSPAGGSFTQASAVVQIGWCDDYKLNMVTREVWLNNAPVTTGDAPGTSTPGCYSSRVSSLILPLQPGTNQFKAVVRDSAGNLSDTLRATFTHTPRLTLVSPDGVRRPALCEASCFDATLEYATPAYISLDQARSAALLYSSAHAQPRGFVQLDLANDPGAVPATVGLRLVRSNGAAEPLLGGTETIVHYAGAAGTQRLSAWFDASGLATGTYRYRAEVTRSYGGTLQTDTLGVRLVIINQAASVYGAGWSLAGQQKIILPSGGMDPSGVTLVEGDGNSVFFRAPGTCSLSGPCTYLSPASEFTTLARTSSGYARLGLDGDSAVFDATGRLLRVVDSSGNTTTLNYYGGPCATCIAGEVASVQDPTGNLYGLAYQPGSGLFSAFTLNGGSTPVSAAVYSGTDLVAVQDPDGLYALSSVAYANHRLTGYTDRAGNRTDLLYDAWGKLSRVIGPVYRAQGSTAYRDTVTLRSREAAVLPAQGTGTAAVPGTAVQPGTAWMWIAGVRGDTTRFRVDGWGAAIEARDPRGYTSVIHRNADGLVTWAQDARGNTDSTAWSGPRMMSRVPNGDLARSTYVEYNGPGQRVSRIFGATPETRLFYTSTAGRVLLDSVRTAGSGTTRYNYDARGRVLTEVDSAGHATTAAYEPGGWQNTRSVTAAGGQVTQTAVWDGWGRSTQTVTPDGKLTTTAYDALGRPATVTAPDAGTTRYHYGAVFVDSMTDARGQVFRWTRNQLGWVEREVRPADVPGQHREAVYDRYGRVAIATDRRGVATSITYDALDRPTLMMTSHATIPNRVRSFAYSPAVPGNPAAPRWVSVSNGTVFLTESTDTLHYDGEGRLSRAVTLRPLGAGGVTAYEVVHTYAAQGTPDTLRYRVNGGAWRSMRMQTSSSTLQLSSLRDFSGGITYLNYNGEGGLASIYLPNGVSSTYNYTSTHELSRVTYSAPGLNSVAGTGYRYDTGNRIASRTNAAQNRTRDYLYDPNGRLQQVTDRQRSTSHTGCTLQENTGWDCPEDQQWTLLEQRVFSYDKVGNPTDAGAQTLAGNRLTSYRGWTVQYDGEGNLVSRGNGTQTYAYTWDGLGQLAEVRLNGVLTTTYGYDGLGHRVAKRRPGACCDEHYLYDGDDVLLDLVALDGSVAAEYTYYPGTDQVHSVFRNGVRHYYAADRQGSVMAMVDAAGTVVNQYKYDSFGGAESVSEGVANRLRWIGREWDADAGLYYVRARWYEPTLQRFISEDPIGLEGGINMYAYSGNDPVNNKDPSGLIYCWSGGGTEAWGYALFLNPDCRILINRLNLGWGRGAYPDWMGGSTSNAQDVWSPLGFCRALPVKCDLKPPSAALRTFALSSLDGLRNTSFCRRVAESGRSMIARQLGGFENRVPYDTVNGEERILLGEAPFHTGLGGPVMYLYTGPGLSTRRRRHTVVHEAIHGLIDPAPRIPGYYADGATTEIGLDIDDSATFCVGRR